MRHLLRRAFNFAAAVSAALLSIPSYRIVANGLCLLMALICIALRFLEWKSHRGQTYFVCATRSGHWWLANFGDGRFSVVTWRGEPTAVWPEWYFVAKPDASGADLLLYVDKAWRWLGFQWESGELVGVPAGRVVSDTDHTLKRHEKDAMRFLDPDFEGPWSGWGAYVGSPPSNGGWMCECDSCTEFQVPL